MVSVSIVHVGGSCDSENPRKIHIADEYGNPICGQYFFHIERYEQSETNTDPAEDIGEWCDKCRKKYLKR